LQKIKKFKYPLTRTTVGEYLSFQNLKHEIPGIYVFACYPSLGCLYIGISDNVLKRIREHLTCAEEPFGTYIRNQMADSCSWRLDIFEVEEIEDRLDLERKLIKKFHPVFNSQGLESELQMNENHKELEY